MRDIFVIIAILAIVFGGNFLINEHVNETGKDFLNMMETLEDGIETDKKEVKDKQVDELIKLWEENEKKWIMVEYHQEINQIEDLVIECYTYYLQGDKELFEVSYKKLERNIEDMQNRVRITFTNIL